MEINWPLLIVIFISVRKSVAFFGFDTGVRATIVERESLIYLEMNTEKLKLLDVGLIGVFEPVILGSESVRLRPNCCSM